MKYVITLLVLCLTDVIYGQGTVYQDSTEIKLAEYKKLYNKGLINSAEYQAMRLKILGLKVQVPLSDKDRLPDPPDNPVFKKPYYERKVMANVRIIPLAYFEVSGTYTYYPNPPLAYKEKIRNANYGGAHVEIGPAINKMFHPNFVFGLEGNKTTFLLPVYADLNINLNKGKFSPFVHFGFGYIAFLDNPSYTHPGTMDLILQHGLNALAGIGLNVNIARFFSLAIAPDYRFIYAVENQGNLRGAARHEPTNITILHQIGVRAECVFY